jgi:hypothetical protein
MVGADRWVKLERVIEVVRVPRLRGLQSISVVVANL